MGMLIDVLVIIAYFAGVIFVGLKLGNRENTLESFALGGRSIPWWAVLASIIAAETSAATFLGQPTEGYKLVNYSMLQLLTGTVIGRVIVAFLFLKPFYDNNVFSIYEYLQLRFGNLTRSIASAIFLVTRLLASGTRLYVGAIVLAVGYSVFTGQVPSQELKICIYLCAIIFLTFVTAIYTSVGGIKAVVWTDCIQASVMIGGAIATICCLVASNGAVSAGSLAMHDYFTRPATYAFSFGTEAGKSMTDFLLNTLKADYTVWAGILGMTFTALATHGTDQDMVQRMLTAPDYKKSRLSLILSGLADIPIGIIFLTIGILLQVHYQVQGGPKPASPNEVFAHYIMTDMPTGLRGLLIAGVFATSMGSLSAALNALATSFTRDWYQKSGARIGKQRTADEGRTEEESVSMVRKSTYVFAVLMVLVAGSTAFFVIKNPDSRIIPIVLGIFGYTYGSLLGIFLTGFCTKARGNDTGNAIAMVCGFITVGLISGLPNQILTSIGAPAIEALKSIPTVSFPWRIMFGSLITFAIACLFKTKPRELAES